MTLAQLYPTALTVACVAQNKQVQFLVAAHATGDDGAVDRQAGISCLSARRGYLSTQRRGVFYVFYLLAASSTTEYRIAIELRIFITGSWLKTAQTRILSKSRLCIHNRTNQAQERFRAPHFIQNCRKISVFSEHINPKWNVLCLPKSL